MNALLLTMLTLTCHQSAGEPPPLVSGIEGRFGIDDNNAFESTLIVISKATPTRDGKHWIIDNRIKDGTGFIWDGKPLKVKVKWPGLEVGGIAKGYEIRRTLLTIEQDGKHIASVSAPYYSPINDEPPPLDVAPLIRDLGGDYKARTTATRKLSAMGEDARPALLKAAAADDREVSRRAEMLIFWLDQARRKRAVAMIDAAFPEPLPWLDLAYIAPCDDVARGILEPIYFAAPDGPEPHATCPECWGRYRMATRHLCYQMAEAGVPLWAIRMMIAELVAREAKWMESYRGTR